MNNENKTKAPARRGHGPNFEKPKNFKKSILKLFSKLKPFQVAIYISLILAALGSILSLVTPNRLSDLTDEIQKGIVINSKNLNLITNDIKDEMSNEKFQNKFNEIIDLKFDQNTIVKVNTSNDLSIDDKNKFNDALKNIQNDQKNTQKYISDIPENVLNVILTDTTYMGVSIKKEDKIKLMQLSSNINGKNYSNLFINMPNSIKKVILSTTKVDGNKITSEDKIEMLNIMGTINKKTSVNKIYKKIDKLPKSIQNVLVPSMKMKKIKKISLFLAVLYI